jgi:hypothetical protein
VPRIVPPHFRNEIGNSMSGPAVESHLLACGKLAGVSRCKSREMNELCRLENSLNHALDRRVGLESFQ